MDISKSNDLQNFSADGSCQSMEAALQSPHAIPEFGICDISKEEFDNVEVEHGLGSVYFNKARNRWQAAFYMEEAGEVKRRILSAKTQSEAYYLMAQLRVAQMAFSREKDIPVPVQYHKIKDIRDKMLAGKSGRGESTRLWYRSITNSIVDFLGETYIEELTSEDIHNFISSIQLCKNGRPSSEKRIKEIMTQLNNIVEYAHNEGYISKKPLNDNHKNRPKGVEHNTKENFYTKEEVSIILKDVKQNGSPILRAVVPCLLLTGMRINELLALRYNDLDMERRLIRVQYSVHVEGGKYVLGSPKTAAGIREIPVPDIFFDIVEEWHRHVKQNQVLNDTARAKGNDNIIFIGEVGDIRHSDTLRTACNNMLKRLGLKKKNSSFHAFRHTYGTLVHWSGVEMDIISYLLGHEIGSTKNVTRDVYVKENEETILKEKRSAVDKYMEYMGDIFSGII